MKKTFTNFSIANILDGNVSPRTFEFPSSLDYNSLQLATDLQLLFLLQQTNHLQYPHPPPLPESSRSSTCSSPPASLQSSPSTSPSALSTSPTPKFFSDLFLNEKLVQIQVARTALTPPDWSKRQQGHRAGVQRQRYSADKTGKLMQRYNESKYVTREEMEALADETGLSKQQVKVWFQNCRLKERKRATKMMPSTRQSFFD